MAYIIQNSLYLDLDFGLSLKIFECERNQQSWFEQGGRLHITIEQTN
jgi:hypothetical protein